MNLDLAAQLILTLWAIVVGVLVYASAGSKHGNA